IGSNMVGFIIIPPLFFHYIRKRGRRPSKVRCSIRAFTKSKGITPYRYLETIRINEAKKLLSKGVSPLDAAIRTGFSDQSHFTNYFTSFIGLAPGVYREIFFEKNKDGE
ncbi:MAG: AraC family transcriptional regulator, partial [Lachnospiraceae bacterium]|nr:AraC family transcriptional regulator [Lachnospiraceae bacterium]